MNAMKFKTCLCGMIMCAVFLIINSCAGPAIKPVATQQKAAEVKTAANDQTADEPQRRDDRREGVATPGGEVDALAVNGLAQPPGAPGQNETDRSERPPETYKGGILFEGAGQFPGPAGKGGNEGGELLLNFDDADLKEVIRAFADMLGINYLLDKAVTGKVTIHSAAPIDIKQLFTVFLQVLDANGLTAVQSGGLYQIVKAKDAPRLPLFSRIGRDVEQTGAGQQFIMQVVPLKYMDGQQMSSLITPFISADGTVVSYDDANILILVDKEINIRKALKLVEVFDVNVFEKTNHAIYRLENVASKDAVKVVQELVSAYSIEMQKETKIISIDRLNALIVFSKSERIFDAVSSFIDTLDVPTYNVDPQIYVYSVRNGQAAELSTLLGSVFSEGGSDTEIRTVATEAVSHKEVSTVPPEMGNPFAVPTPARKSGEGTFSGSSVGSGSLKGAIKITADEIRNALIIEAVPTDYMVIEKILNRLDVLPRQVLIEVTIAEINLTDELDFGLEWTYESGDGQPSTSVLNATLNTAEAPGLSYIIGESKRWQNVLKTKAKENKVKILSSPSVLASDNKKAVINIATELPVASSIYDTTTGDATSTVTTNIQYRNTGVILSVTPHINEFGLVSMDISQEVSEATDGTSIGDVIYPAFFKRSLETSLTVSNDQTIVLGGLIRENESEGDNGIPFLKDIPFLKALFGSVNKSKTKSELILMITPRVIGSLEDVNAVTKEFKQKVRGIKYLQSASEG